MEHSNLVILLLVFLILQTCIASQKLHWSRGIRVDKLDSITTTRFLNATPSLVMFEVSKPIQLPRTRPCSHHVLHHDFGETYGRPPVLANYTPPTHCPSQDFSKIVLEWKATSKGRQFDRIFGVWLGGVEVFRSCTAEPRPNGIVWTVEKDITRYFPLLMQNQTFAVYMGNIVDNTYTGVYHVDVTIHFYPADEKFASKCETLISGYDSIADLIVPISRNLPLNGGLWFEIENSTDTVVKHFHIPQNTYRAVLDIYVSFHENDEFWYSNPPNDYIESNNLSNTPGNGPFREVVVSLDGHVVGAVWPFTVIYTGGVNPLLWKPISGIGSFNLPSYDIEITPSLGNILDGKSHTFQFSVTNALNVWYVDANLHLWLDSEGAQTEGHLTNLITPPLNEYQESKFNGLNGKFLRKLKRSIKSTGWVKSSHGNISTQFVQHLDYKNLMVMGNDGNMQIVKQTIKLNDKVTAKLPSSHVYSIESFKTFPFYLFSNNVDQGNETFLSTANLTLEFEEMKHKWVGSEIFQSSLRDAQTGQGSMVVQKNLLIDGLGSTRQVYDYVSDSLCYFRNVSSSNFTILYDEVRTSKCKI